MQLPVFAREFIAWMAVFPVVRSGWNLLQKYKTFAVYSVIGGSGATLDYVAFLGLALGLGFDKFLANAFSVSAGIANNFVLNALFNFRVRDRLFRRFFVFYCVGMVGLGISSVLLWLGIDVLGWNVSFVKLGSIFFVVLAQYNLNKTLTFSRRVFD